MKYSLFTLGFIFALGLPAFSTGKQKHSKKRKAPAPQIQVTPPQPSENHSSYPYITGYTFRSMCDFILDSNTNNLNPSKVEAGDIIFVSHTFIETFFTEYCPKISRPFILLTHHCYDNGDASTPGPYAHYLENKKLIVWFTVNADIVHPKVKPLPLGIPNSFYGNLGNTKVYDHYIKTVRQSPKTKLLYSNFDTSNNHAERSYVRTLFADKTFCTTPPRKEQPEYLVDLSQHKFILSPPGEGIDCFRTWEALFMGSIPIVRSSALDVLFKDLPVLIIHDWQEITEEFLEQKYKEFQAKETSYRYEKLYIPYWINELLKWKFTARLSYAGEL
jgi:hypothetical protein